MIVHIQELSYCLSKKCIYLFHALYLNEVYLNEGQMTRKPLEGVTYFNVYLILITIVSRQIAENLVEIRL